jgi:hypothetical protein
MGKRKKNDNVIKERRQAQQEFTKAEAAFMSKLRIAEVITKRDVQNIVTAAERVKGLDVRLAKWDFEELKKWIVSQEKLTERERKAQAFEMGQAFEFMYPPLSYHIRTKPPECQYTRDGRFEQRLYHDHPSNNPLVSDFDSYGHLELNTEEPQKCHWGDNNYENQYISWIVAEKRKNGKGGSTELSAVWECEIPMPTIGSYLLSVKSVGWSDCLPHNISFITRGSWAFRCWHKLQIQGPPIKFLKWTTGLLSWHLYCFQWSGESPDYEGLSGNLTMPVLTVRISSRWSNTVRVSEQMVYKLYLGSAAEFESFVHGYFEDLCYEFTRIGSIQERQWSVSENFRPEMYCQSIILP